MPHILWHGHLMVNPARVLDQYRVEKTDAGYDLLIDLDTLWDDTAAAQHAVRILRIPLVLNDIAAGAIPVVDDSRLPDAMAEMLRATAGVGAKNVMGDEIAHLPEIVPSELSEFGAAHFVFTVNSELGALHAGVTAGSWLKICIWLRLCRLLCWGCVGRQSMLLLVRRKLLVIR
ncbi:hypothetical protein RQN30_11825 [Arcanobacterium hippocoleae]